MFVRTGSAGSADRWEPAMQLVDIGGSRVVTIGPDDSIDEAIALLDANEFRHLPVVAEERLVGLISIGDVVKAVIEDHKFAIEQLEHYIMGHR